MFAFLSGQEMVWFRKAFKVKTSNKRRFGDLRDSDGKLFWGYRKAKLTNGTESIYEVWLSKETFERNKERNKKWRSNPRVKERMKQTNKIWLENPENKKRLKQNTKKWRIKNAELIKERVAKYNSLPRSKKLRKIREDRYRKLPKTKERARKYMQKRRAESPEFLLKSRARIRIYRALKRARATKQERTSKLVGCSFLFLKRHIESMFREGMSWDKPNSFHIDHIRPLASFDLTDPEQLKAACHWTNLQPLYPEENIRKGAKILTT